MKPLELILPWPPTVNSYWGGTRTGIRFLSNKGKKFRSEVTEIIHARFPVLEKWTCPIWISVMASAPDRRVRDLDNIAKSLFDALTHAGLYKDDRQLARIDLIRCEPGEGAVHIRMQKLDQPYIPLTEVHHVS